MALEASHIRFALDIRNLFEVKNLNKYISGTIYPDSRYPTGIDRMLTHDDSQMTKDFWHNDDFRKGWAAHLLYDKMQFEVHADWFGDFLKENNPDMTGEEDWIARTALKILQDIDDLHRFDIKPHLSALNYVETPNDEDRIKVTAYNQLFINIYNKAPDVRLEDLEQMWVRWSIPLETAAKMRAKACEMQKNEGLMKLVPKIYDETIARKDEFYNRYCI